MREPAYPYHPGTVAFFHPWPTGHEQTRVLPAVGAESQPSLNGMHDVSNLIPPAYWQSMWPYLGGPR